MTPADPLTLFVTNLDRPVFALRHLPEEVIAVLFAYYSRSADSLRDNLRKLLAEGDLAVPAAGWSEGDDSLAAAQAKAQEFHEKWVVGYGHSSVAEHAVVHLAVEGLSIVATKVLEDNRLASYTEKSTRYVRFDADSFVREPSLMASPLAARYEDTCRRLLATYTDLLPQVTAQVAERFGRPADWTDRRYDSVCRAKAFDIVRYLLPAATRTNVGLTVNGRSLEHLLTKLYSHPLGELRALATAVHHEAQHIVPTLLKYAAPNEYLQQTPPAVAARAAELLGDLPAAPAPSGARLISAPAEPLLDLAAAIVYETCAQPLEQVKARLAEQGRPVWLAIIDEYLGRRGRFDAPLRALEHLVYTFELVVDYGAYRDIQRHRMCTQTAQPLTAALGYETPPEIEDMGHGPTYHAVMGAAAEAQAAMLAVVGAEAAQYVLPLAYRKRVLYTWNLRELHHFISLRSSRQGHRSYRCLAQQCWHELSRVHPELAAAVRVDLADYDLARG